MGSLNIFVSEFYLANIANFLFLTACCIVVAASPCSELFSLAVLLLAHSMTCIQHLVSVDFYRRFVKPTTIREYSRPFCMGRLCTNYRRMKILSSVIGCLGEKIEVHCWLFMCSTQTQISRRWQGEDWKEGLKIPTTCVGLCRTDVLSKWFFCSPSFCFRHHVSVSAPQVLTLSLPLVPIGTYRFYSV